MIALFRSRFGSETAQRRWRGAILVGLVALLALAGFTLAFNAQMAQASRMVAVLKATQDIRAGSTITSDELAGASIRSDDPSVISSLMPSARRGDLVGQVAVMDVHEGNLIPNGIAVPQSQAGMWEVPLPVKRMPSGLQAGDHVALLATVSASSGVATDAVIAQDVRVLHVGTDSATLWLPAASAAQVEWLADHSGIVLLKMPAGAIQNVNGGSQP